MVPLLLGAFNSLLQGHSFQSDSLTAIVSILPKPHSDDTSWTNYRSISRLNVDIKILAKLLSSHINLVIGALFYSDQVGFIPSRQAGDSVR